MKQHILFVCLGNICRSPAAHGVLETMAAQRGLEELFEVDSAGTYSGHQGSLPDSRMRSAAAKRGYNLTHRARPVCVDDFHLFDRIITMDDNNFHNVCSIAPSREAEAKVERFSDLITEHRDVHYIPDPYYSGRDGFEEVLDLLEDGCQTILARSNESR